MFRPVPTQVSFPELDAQLLAFWDEHRIFEKAVRSREGAPPFVFYEGPPTANGMPHPGHVLTRVMKDVYLRYKTMRGYHVPRRGGWDTHGLPVEVEVEKDLGISGRIEIEKYGVEAFTKKCIESVFRYIEEWRRMTRRIGFWVDLDQAYVTFHRSYVESVWWALSELFKQGLLYQDYKVVWWWPQGGTALSSGEVGQGYKTVDDPSVVIRFPSAEEPNTSFLAWTTTPWTLPSNVALAVDPNQDYARVALEDHQVVILAAATVERVLGKKPHAVLGTVRGQELCGKKYLPPFQYASPEGGASYVVVPADFVTLDTGTGMVHVAPAFGEDDFRVAKEQKLGFLQLVRPDGTFPPEVTDFAGRFCKEADRDIIRNLRQRGVLFSEEVYRHEYPFCWRKDTDPLIQYARRSWFIRTTKQIDNVIQNNQSIHWEPEHIKEGRFGSFLRSNVDWALSRERFWGTPLPIWINDVTGNIEAVSSAAEIIDRNPVAFEAFDEAQKQNPSLSDHLRVHKPWIDAVTWTRPNEPGVYRRVTEVIDCWFDSGCMPFAQWGYPHQSQKEFGSHFPADFITEAVDQTRGWFYSLLTISTLLFPEAPKPHPFKNCVVLGIISDDKGQKLSKSKRNYTDPLILMEQHGGDALRWGLYAQTIPGQTTRFSDAMATDALKEFLLKIWNVYSFFVTYANIDRWTPNPSPPPLSERPDMDRWILAELDGNIRSVIEELDAYRSHLAVRRLESFVDALSNWYVRRSRARFWSSENTIDKSSAFHTLYEVLVDVSKIIAPFTPFLSEALHQNLVRSLQQSAEESVHLAKYPEPSDARVDLELQKSVGAVRDIVALGQRVRTDSKIRVRQPLGEAVVVVADEKDRARIARFESAISEELNVKRVSFTQEATEYVQFQLIPNFRVLGPKIGPRLPECKKALATADSKHLYSQLESKGAFSLPLQSGDLVLTREEVEIRLEAKEHFAAAAFGGRVVILDTNITDELRREGLAREVINRIQRARKTMDLPYEARIQIAYESAGELSQAMEEHREHIMSETLASQMSSTNGSVGERHETNVEGHALTFFIQVA